MTQQSNPTNAVRAFVAVGSNLRNPIQQIDTAILAIGAHPQIKRTKLAKLYQSKPLGPQAQPDFINSVLEISTTLPAQDLLTYLLQIEKNQGRERTIHWGPRNIDLDIILYDNLICTTETLILPHPRAHEREFVVIPLQDIDTQITIPNAGEIADLVVNFKNHKMKVIRDVTTYNS